MEELYEKIKNIGGKGRLILLGLFLILLLFFSQGMFSRNEKEMAPESDLFEELLAEEEVSEPAKEPEADIPKEVVVDVKGAVHAPGVYRMPENSRVIDVINQAGGTTPEANQNGVNFAQILDDQMVVYIPKIGEEGFEIIETISSSASTDETGQVQVNLNTAQKDELMTLKGIGPAKADSILAYREENGLFESIDEIKNVSGIGDATFESLKETITVDP